MGGGETDAAAYARQQLAASRSLDAFTRCTATGCEVNVHLMAADPVRCHEHGGRDGVPEYMTSATDGSFIHVRHLSLPAGGDCE